MYWLVITLVFLNTVCVAIEHHGQPQWMNTFLGTIYPKIVEKNWIGFATIWNYLRKN